MGSHKADKERTDFNKRVGARLAELRRKEGMTQEQLSEASGISTKYIGHIEQGRKGMTLYVAQKVADGLGIEIGELIENK